MPKKAFQDYFIDNHCFGCGADNPSGLHLKSYWDGDVGVARWQPNPDHAAGPRQILNGGIIATLLDCHAICTAIANEYLLEGRDMASEPEIWCVTASMTIEYLRPTPLAGAVQLSARVAGKQGRDTTLECWLEADGKARARATLRAVRVGDEWRHGSDPLTT